MKFLETAPDNTSAALNIQPALPASFYPAEAI